MSSIVISGDTSGTLTIAAPSVAGTNTATLPAATGTVMVTGNMPAFSYYQNSTQTLSAATNTKLLFQASEYDTTSGMVASSRFTPTIAGYYIFTAAWQASTVASDLRVFLYKNGGSIIKNMSSSVPTANWNSGTAMAYCNGTTDYIEIYGYSASLNTTNPTQASTYFQGAMVRAA